MFFSSTSYNRFYDNYEGFLFVLKTTCVEADFQNKQKALPLVTQEVEQFIH